MSKVFINIGLSLDACMAPDGMTMPGRCTCVSDGGVNIA